MKNYYDWLIHNRFFPILLAVLIAGYIVAIFNISYFGYLPLINKLQLARYPFLDPAANFIDQNNYIINLDPLKNFYTNVSNGLGPNKMSVYLETLNSGANISVNKDLTIWPASLAKLPLAIAILNKVEENGINLSDELPITAADVDNRSGNLYVEPVGTEVSVNELLRALLVDSDNTAQHILLRQITANDMQELINNIGLEAPLTDPNGKISAKGYTRFLRTLYTSNYLTKEHSEEILNLLTEATFKDFLSQGLPNSVAFSHKYGEDIDNNIFIDSGIVYLLDRPYMITVMMQNVTRDQAKVTMKSVSETTYQYMNQFNNGMPPTVPVN